MPSAVIEVNQEKWTGDPAANGDASRWVEALEGGSVLFLPRLAFDLAENERQFLTPSILDASKNVSFNPATGKVGGTVLTGSAVDEVGAMMKRFSDGTRALVEGLLPDYRPKLSMGRTSFRPAEIEGRASSWRKDDTRLHIDAFPSTPTRGNRILRVFCNLNPDGRSRVWRVGEPFENVAKKFAPTLRRPVWGSSSALNLLGITKGRRSEYDHLMLQLHDRMKEDTQYQTEAPQTRCEFPPGSTWMVFVDAVSHAAMSGQHQLEQTFYISVDAMRSEPLTPLRVLERHLGRKLA